MIEPVLDYIHAKEVKFDTGVVTTSDITDTTQYYEVIAVGPGRQENGYFFEPPCKPGDTIIIQKHAAEGDTPEVLRQKGQALFMASRIMAIIKGDKRG